MILADKILELRKQNGWSQEELADKLGVSRQAVSKWEGAQSIPDMERIIALSRLFGVTEPIDSPQGKKAVESIALQAIKGVDPATHNQAMMEFGALQCVPKSPDCHHCVFKNQCFAICY